MGKFFGSKAFRCSKKNSTTDIYINFIKQGDLTLFYEIILDYDKLFFSCLAKGTFFINSGIIVSVPTNRANCIV